MYSAQRHFVDSLLSGAEFETNGRDYLRPMAVCEATYRSAEIAAQTLREERPDIRIETVDTLTAAMAEGIVAIRASEDVAERQDARWEVDRPDRVAPYLARTPVERSAASP